MGKLPSQPIIQHFSHPHPLQLSNHQPQQTLCLSTCSGCKLKASGWIYTCTNCNYFLHISCSQLPQRITHPFDINHVLSLLSTPIYPEGLFSCDACGKQGNGFSYHCGTCNIDLHTTCATMPLIIDHQSHHHQLSLTFSIPYVNESFCCDICRNVGSKQWIYRCNLCEFDAHLDCSTTEVTPAPFQAPIQQAQYCQRAPTTAITQCQVVGSQVTRRPPMQSFVPNNPVTPSAFASTMFMDGGRSNQLGSPLLDQALQNLVSSSSQSLGQTMLQGILGGGGGHLVGEGGGSSGGIDLGSILGVGGSDLGSVLSRGGIDLGSILGGTGSS